MNSAARTQAKTTATDWGSLRQLRRVLRGRPATYTVYCSLWDQAGGKLGQVKTTYGEIGADCAMSGRSAKDHVDALIVLGLADLADHDKRSGVLTLRVNDYREFGMPRRVAGDPQAEIEFDSGDPTDDTPADEPATLAIDPSARGLRAETPGRGLRTAEAASTAEAQQVESEPTVAARSSPPADDRRAISNHGTIERVTSKQNHNPIEQPDYHGPWRDRGLRAETPGRAPAADSAIDARDLSDFEAKRQREIERVDREAPRPKSMDAVVAAAVNRWADRVDKAQHPLQQKHELAQLVVKRVNDPGMARQLAEFAAAYVVDDGMPVDVLFAVLAELDEADRKGKIRTSRGQWFLAVVRKRIAACGIPERGRNRRRQLPRAP
jgi:hypothetical protein